MKSRQVVFLVALISIALLSTVSIALSYFGIIEKNRLVLKLEVATEEEASMHNEEFPCYLLLHNGYPVLSNKPNIKEGDNYEIGKLDIVCLTEITDKRKREPNETMEAFWERYTSSVKHTQYLLFEFTSDGWSTDKYVTMIKIPYSIDENDKKQMLKIADKGTMEIRWRDPKNKAVTVVSYWTKFTSSFSIKVTVLENTLGFGNKVGVDK